MDHLPQPEHQQRHGNNLFVWHEGTKTERGYSNVVGCRDHICLQVWQDPATRRLVVTAEAIQGVNHFGGYTVRYLFNEETGPFDRQADLIAKGTQIHRLAVAQLLEVDLD